MEQIELLLDLTLSQLVTMDYKLAFGEVFANEREAVKFVEEHPRYTFVGVCFPIGRSECQEK